MNKDLEEQREQLKARISREVDKYYTNISDSIEAGKVRIEKMEQMLIETKAQINGLVNEATGQAYSEKGLPTEKNVVRCAQGSCTGKVEPKR